MGSRAPWAAGLALAVLGLAAMPAGAVETGAGITPSGFFNAYNQKDDSPLAPLPLCIENTQTAVLTLNNTGTFTAGPGNIFEGDTVATVSIASGHLFFNPEGTFTDGTCTVPAFGPTGELASISISKVSGTGTVSCSGNGTYGRDGEVGLVTFNGACTVNGVTTSPVLTEFNGLEQPCFPDGPPPEDPCAIVPEWVGTYTQT
jgi:hypothetical protein